MCVPHMSLRQNPYKRTDNYLVYLIKRLIKE